MNNQGFFNAFQDAITSPATIFLHNSLAIGHEIFVTIFVAMVVIGLCKCAIAQDFNMFWWNMGSLLFKMIPPVVALNFSQIIIPNLKGITDFFVGRITGSSTTSPDGLATLGWQTGMALIHAASTPLHDDPVAPSGLLHIVMHPDSLPVILVNTIIAFFASAIIVFAFTYVAIELVLAWYQVILASSVGAASVGFFGSEATSDMAFRYTSGVISGVWKVIFLSVWPATVSAVFLSFHFATDLQDPQKFFSVALGIFSFGLIVMFSTTRISHMADNMFTGQTSLTLKEIGRSIEYKVHLVNKVRNK